MNNDVSFSRKLTREALKLWYKLDKLAEHPYSKLKVIENRHKASKRGNLNSELGNSLRDVLDAAIQEIRPYSSQPNWTSKQWYSFIILEERFKKGRNRGYLANKFHISLRSYDYAQGEAIDLITNQLQTWEHDLQTKPSYKQSTISPFLAPPKPPYQLVGRYNFLQVLKENLFNRKDIALYALNGFPGVGKTAIALEIAHDKEVVDHFTDGILWAGLGKEPDIFTLLGKWGIAIGIAPNVLSKISTIQGRAKAIHERIGMKKMLLIMDDVWQLKDALSLQVGGIHCVHLLTTRQKSLARDFAEGGAIVVKELSDAAGLLLFDKLAPKITELKPDEIQHLIRVVGGLPLAILLMAKYARHKLYSQESLNVILDELKNSLKRMSLSLVQSPLHHHPSLNNSEFLSLQVSIQLSIQHLQNQALIALYSLSLLPPKPSSFSSEAAVSISKQPHEVIEQLHEQGLIEKSGENRYMLHQTISDYAQEQLNSMDIHKQAIQFFVDYILRHKDKHDLIELELTNILHILNMAEQLGFASDFSMGVHGLDSFWDTRGYYTQAENYLERSVKIATASQHHIDRANSLQLLSGVMLNTGNYERASQFAKQCLQIIEKFKLKQSTLECFALTNLGVASFTLGAQEIAEKYYKKALEIAHEIGNTKRISLLLTNLGLISARRGDLKTAEIFYLKGLDLAKDTNHLRRISLLQVNLGVLYFKQGKFSIAEAHLQEGLHIAKQINYKERICFLVCNLGELARLDKRFEEAQIYLSDGLDIAKEINHPQLIGIFHMQLGTLLMDLDRFDEAQTYYEEALNIAQSIKDSWLLIETKIVWGELYLAQYNLGLAYNLFDSAYKIAKSINTNEQMAYACWGLARTIYNQDKKNIQNAEILGKKSLKLFTKVGSFKASEVRQWLASLNHIN